MKPTPAAVSTTSAVPASLVVSGEGTWTGGESLSPFTVTIPAGSKSATINLSALTLSGPWQGLGNGSTSGAYTGTFIASLATADSIAQQVGYASPGYDYAVDPSASGVSATETIGANTVMGFGGVVSTTQSGNTIQVTLYGGVNWSTANGTALAGTDYQSNAGSTPAGDTQTTVDITLENLSALSDTTFFIVTSGGGLSGTFYDPIIIQTIAPQLLADSNNDGRIDATADAAANAAAITNNTGGVLVDPDPGNDPTAPTNDQSSSQYDPANSGLALVTSGRLVEIDLDLYSLQGLGTSVTLTAQGDTSDFAVWTDPSRTMQITVTGSGTTWPTSQAPAQVWVEAPEGGSQGTSAPAITLMLALQNQSSGQPQSSSVRVQAAPILDARVVKDNPTNATFNAPTSVWLSATPAQLKQGAYVPLDNEDLDNNGTPDDLQATPVATDNLLPIAIRNSDGTPITQGGWYTLGFGNNAATALPKSVRIWLNTGTSQTPVFEQVTNLTQLDPSSNIYVEAVGKDGKGIQPVNVVLTLFWHDTATPTVKPISSLKINEFSILGPRDVPELSTYNYAVQRATGEFTAGGAITGGARVIPAGQQYAGQYQVTWAAAPNGAWGKVDFNPNKSAYTWAAHIAVVGITLGDMTFNATGTPAQVPGTNKIDSTNQWEVNANVTGSQVLPAGGLAAAMTASVTVTSIAGPGPLPGWSVPAGTIYGVTHIQIGFAQQVYVNQENVHYQNSTYTSGNNSVKEGGTYIDGITSGPFTSNSTLTQRNFGPFPAGYTPTAPWYGQTGPISAGPAGAGAVGQRSFLTPTGPVTVPITFSIGDTPNFVDMNIAGGSLPDAVNLDWRFETSFVVHTVDTDDNPTGFSSMQQTYNLQSNANIYIELAAADWEFNGSGSLNSPNAGLAGTWTAIPGVTGVTGDAQMFPSPVPGAGGRLPILNQQAVAAAIKASKPDVFFNNRLNTPGLP